MNIEDLPGFRRRFAIVPREGEVTAAVEDDVHCMAVTLRHDGKTVTGVSSEMHRAPWSTCPGARQVLEAFFVGVSLARPTERGGKKSNCTHLYDLAELAAAHARDAGPTSYELLVSDPDDGEVWAQLRRDGEAVLDWHLKEGIFVSPEALAGCGLLNLRERIGDLTGAEREAARILQWGSLIAHGRTMPWDAQAQAQNLPPNCYTLQPEMAAIAERAEEMVDFSSGGRVPLSRFTGTGFAD